MYTDEDLNFAIKHEVFSEQSVKEFRALLATQKNSPAADEENFKLIASFNDIFIVIACSLLLFSTLWVLTTTLSKSVGLLAFTILSWCLAEFFVLKRKMALPAIMLLLSFIGGTFALVISLFPSSSGESIMTAAALSTMLAYVHWLRFKVPITVAVGTATGVGVIASFVVSLLPQAEHWLFVILFLCGVFIFILAMYWDASDTSRTTRNSDVAFWLHLLSAPLMIHPVFSSLGVLDGSDSLISMAVVLLLYVLMTFISLTIDRRAFMVSSLVYVLYALSDLIKTYGGVGYSFALTGVMMGAALLLLSAYWHRVRGSLISTFPNQIKHYIPRGKLVS